MTTETPAMRRSGTRICTSEVLISMYISRVLDCLPFKSAVRRTVHALQSRRINRNRHCREIFLVSGKLPFQDQVRCPLYQH